MFCYKCGAAMSDQATACPSCGLPVHQGPQPAGSQPASQPGVAAAQQPAPAYTQQPVSPWLNVPPAPAYRGDQQTDGKAVASLILGILAIFPMGLLAGIPAVILGHVSKAEIRKSLGRMKGEGMALAGLIMGYISLAMIPLVLIIAAIAIPNLLRARQAANEAGAAATVRTLNAAQVTYLSRNPQTGYAMSLAVLGPGAPAVDCSNSGGSDAYHACLINAALGCSSAGWCEKGGYRYHITGVCSGDQCTNYVITATPETTATGMNSFCSVDDAVIRIKSGVLLEPLTTTDECESWGATH